MNLVSAIMITLISSLTIFLLFLVIGTVGIDRNRKAQGLDDKMKN